MHYRFPKLVFATLYLSQRFAISYASNAALILIRKQGSLEKKNEKTQRESNK